MNREGGGRDAPTFSSHAANLLRRGSSPQRTMTTSCGQLLTAQCPACMCSAIGRRRLWWATTRMSSCPFPINAVPVTPRNRLPCRDVRMRLSMLDRYGLKCRHCIERPATVRETGASCGRRPSTTAPFHTEGPQATRWAPRRLASAGHQADAQRSSFASQSTCVRYSPDRFDPEHNDGIRLSHPYFPRLGPRLESTARPPRIARKRERFRARA